MRAGWMIAGVLAGSAVPISVMAQSARDLLVQAAFQDRSVDVALAHINRAQALATATLQRDPDDADAAVLVASSAGYRAKLTGDRSQALAARRQFEALVARFPRNPEAQACLGAWHIGIIQRVGRLVGRAAAGARESAGFAALDRSVTLGGNRAFFPGLAGLLRLNLDPDDATAVALIESASRAPTPTPLDRLMQRAAQAVLPPLRTGDRKTARRLADRLLPFGWYDDARKG